MQAKLGHLIPVAMFLVSNLLSASAKACLGGVAEYGNAVLRAGQVFEGDTEVAFPAVSAENANKVLSPPLRLIDTEKLKISVLYIETTATFKIASVVYQVKQDGHETTTVQVKSNVSASGVKTRSIAPPPADIPREKMPIADYIHGCASSEKNGSGVSR